MNKKICDIKELLLYIKTSILEIRKLLREKKILHFRVGNRTKFDINKINKLLENYKKKKKLLYQFPNLVFVRNWGNLIKPYPTKIVIKLFLKLA